MSASLTYRADIDGLRSLAILPVLLYHAGIPGFSGGFIGVDIFFVISGFLIASILISDIKAERLSLSNFYIRRARRLFPAMFVVFFATLVIAYLVLLPSELRTLGEAMAAAVLYVSNFFFYSEAGYFSTEAKYSPLLHTWSLAIEEQFYLCAPLALYFVYRFFNLQARTFLILLGLLASLGLCIWGTYAHQSLTFYMLPFRAWELLAGVLLAVLVVEQHLQFGNGSSQLAGAIGLLLILIGVFGLDSTMLFPGFIALVPVVGTVLIILSSSSSSVSTVGKLLSFKPLVLVGLMSYSLYLWHWPLFTFMRAIFGQSPNYLVVIGFIALSFVAAWLSYRFIERPFRKFTFFSQGKTVAGGIAVCTGAVLLLSFLIVKSEGYPNRFSEEVLAAESFLEDSSSYRDRCHETTGKELPYAEKCTFGAAQVSPTYAVWGDSHAMEISDALGYVSEKYGRSGLHISYSSCPPALGFEPRDRPECLQHNISTLKGLEKDRRIESIVLAFRASHFVDRPVRLMELISGIASTAKSLSDNGKQVVIFFSYPEADEIVPLKVARNIYLTGRGELAVSVAEHRDKNLVWQSYLKSVVTERIVIFDPVEHFCSDVCNYQIDGTVMLFDDDHLSLQGANKIAPELYSVLFN